MEDANITLVSKDSVHEVLFEHLKNLKQAAEECEDHDLGLITSAMIQTAEFLTRPPKSDH